MLQMPCANARIRLALLKSFNEIKKTSVNPNGDLEGDELKPCHFDEFMRLLLCMLFWRRLLRLLLRSSIVAVTCCSSFGLQVLVIYIGGILQPLSSLHDGN